MSQQQVQIDIHHLVNMGLQGLDRMFFRVPKEQAKKLYKEISDGRPVDMGSINFKDNRLEPLRLKLALDHSEFVGHLTFHLFRNALQQTLRHLAQKMQAKQDLRIFNAENGEEIVLFTPGVIQHDSNINVMVMGIVPSRQSAVIKLQFLDPEQFRKSSESADQGAQPAVVASEESEEKTA